MSETAQKMRRIRSFVLRTGRMTEGQKRAYDLHWPSKGLELKNGAIVLPEVFGRDAPVVLEIGFGMGDSLAQMAAAEPDKDFIGVEVHSPGVGRLMHLIDESGIENLRAYCDDAVEVLEQCIADNSLSRVQIYFPDPWHKKRHHKRRLINQKTLDIFAKILKPRGKLIMTTDVPYLAEWMCSHAIIHPDFTWTAESHQSWEQAPQNWISTKYEQKGAKGAKKMVYLIFEKT